MEKWSEGRRSAEKMRTAFSAALIFEPDCLTLPLLDLTSHRLAIGN